ncbi:pyridoxal 5'-phosphate synthase glutaminase subunit PdxT [Clostridium sp. SHJSY1]|uniref:pyridoxal 5'-phosphate synthase glutaminase subunit PdxT n=1 Tax=Clostridium sp. SHJSY1 TaxID=2942483 RepID=UPI0028752929|nr:pyridoxal 5'-phosphate synthase glutaminase subunit PdxT [Clostridium sp. SHJSY1]MDS0524568.1 pyridoxal 5'-phosphate synthase glutaminase subunit PdxT [Clostridium sp. SHJSY1]
MYIGVLSLQGGVTEHLRHIEQLGHVAIQVKESKDLDGIDGLILPGGESTTMGKLLNLTGLLEPLRNKIILGLPTWGTCAGMILLAKEIENDNKRHLSLMNIKVKRNAFGSQIDSFKINRVINKISKNPLELVFIRAPYVTEVGENVDIICKVNKNIVAVREKNMLATAFHPELTTNLEFLAYFIKEFIGKNPKN